MDSRTHKRQIQANSHDLKIILLQMQSCRLRESTLNSKRAHPAHKSMLVNTCDTIFKLQKPKHQILKNSSLAVR
jgi:hypothetical protein